MEAAAKCKVIESMVITTAHKLSKPAEAKTRHLIAQRKEAYRSRSRADVKTLSKRIQKEMKTLDRQRRSEQVKTILEEFRDLGRLEKTRTRKVSRLISSIKAPDGAVKKDRNEIANVFADFFAALCSDSNRVAYEHHEHPAQPIADVTKKEVIAQLAKMATGKCADESGIVAELVIYGGADLAAEFAAIFTDILQRQTEVPPDWKLSNISVLFKKGNAQLPENYRPTCITPILYRLFSMVLLSQVHDTLDAAQSTDQAGFRPGFGCVDHIFALTSLVEKANEFSQPVWIATLDFQKAFDSVSHAAIWDALAAQGVHTAYIDMLQRLYEDQLAKAQTDRPVK